MRSTKPPNSWRVAFSEKAGVLRHVSRGPKKCSRRTVGRGNDQERALIDHESSPAWALPKHPVISAVAHRSASNSLHLYSLSALGGNITI